MSNRGRPKGQVNDHMATKDLLILDALIKEPRLSAYDLSRKTGIPLSTVQRHMKALVVNGAMKGLTLLNPEYLKAVCYIVVIEVKDHDLTFETSIREIRQVYMIQKCVELTRKGYVITCLVNNDVRKLDNLLQAFKDMPQVLGVRCIRVEDLPTPNLAWSVGYLV